MIMKDESFQENNLKWVPNQNGLIKFYFTLSESVIRTEQIFARNANQRGTQFVYQVQLRNCSFLAFP